MFFEWFAFFSVFSMALIVIGNKAENDYAAIAGSLILIVTAAVVSGIGIEIPTTTSVDYNATHIESTQGYEYRNATNDPLWLVIGTAWAMLGVAGLGISATNINIKRKKPTLFGDGRLRT